MNDETRRKFLIRSIGSLGTAIPIIYYGCDSGGTRGGPLGPSGAGVFTPTAAVIPVSVIPKTVSLTKSGSQTFTATRSAGSSFTWSVSNSSMGSIGVSTGVFTAGTTAGTVNVVATDTQGVGGSGTVTIVSAAIIVTPSSVTIPNNVTVNGVAPTTTAPYTMTFTASGGTSPYTYNLSGLSTGYTGASLNLTTGVLSISSFPTADDTVTITATDVFGDNGTATVVIEQV